MTPTEYEQLYASLRLPVLKILHSNSRIDHSLADELSQQVWLKVWRYRENEVNDLTHWVYSITREVIVTHFRRERVRRSQSTDWQDIELADDQTTRHNTLREEHDRLARLHEVLPLELHPVLDAWLAGKSDIEIGQAIGVPAGSVAYHKNRVREHATRIG